MPCNLGRLKERRILSKLALNRVNREKLTLIIVAPFCFLSEKSYLFNYYATNIMLFGRFCRRANKDCL